MSTKTEPSERARRCAEDIRIAFIAANTDTSLWACISDDKLAAIIARHFEGYEELLAFYGAHTCAWAGAETVRAQVEAERQVESALRRAGVLKQAGSSSPPAAG